MSTPNENQLIDEFMECVNENIYIGERTARNFIILTLPESYLDSNAAPSGYVGICKVYLHAPYVCRMVCGSIGYSVVNHVNNRVLYEYGTIIEQKIMLLFSYEKCLNKDIDIHEMITSMFNDADPVASKLANNIDVLKLY